MSSVEQAIIHFENVLIKLERRIDDAPDISVLVRDALDSGSYPMYVLLELSQIQHNLTKARVVLEQASELDLNAIELRNLLNKHLPDAINKFNKMNVLFKQFKQSDFYENLKTLNRAMLHYMNNIQPRNPELEFDEHSRFLETKYG